MTKGSIIKEDNYDFIIYTSIILAKFDDILNNFDNTKNYQFYLILSNYFENWFDFL